MKRYLTHLSFFVALPCIGSDLVAPRAAEIVQVKPFPSGFAGPQPATFVVFPEVIKNLLARGSLVESSRRGEIFKACELTTKSGTILNDPNETRPTHAARAHEADLRKLSLSTFGVIVTRDGKIWFYQMLNDCAFTLFDDTGQSVIVTTVK